MAGGYDGEVRIRTLIENGDASSRLLQLESRFQKTARGAQKLTDEMREMEKCKIPTEQYKNLQNQLETLVSKENKLSENLKGTEKYVPTEQYKDLQNTFDSLVTKGRKLSEKLKDTEKYVPTERYKEAQAALDRVSGKQSQLNQKMQEWVALGRSTNSISYKKMQMDMEKCEKDSEQLINALDRLEKEGGDRQINDKWKDVRNQMRQAGCEASQIRAQMTKLEETGRDKAISNKWQEIKDKISQTATETSKVTAEMLELKANGNAYVDPKSTAEYQQKAERLSDVNTQMGILNQQMNEAADKAARAGNTGEQGLRKTQKAVKKTKSAFSSLIQVAGKAKKAISAIGSVAKNAFGKLNGHVGKSANMLTKFAKRVKKIALSLLVFRWVSKVFRQLIESVQLGIQNFAKYSGEFNRKMSELKSSATNLKNAIGAAAIPIVSALTPALTTLCDWLTKAVNNMNQLFSALSGKNVWSQAKKQQVDYAKSLDSTSKQAKKTKAALQGFDELNVISTNDSDSSSSGSNVSYEDLPISDGIKNLKKMLEGEDWTELGAMIAAKLNDAMESIPWDDVQTEAEKIGRRIGTLINGFVEEFDWSLLGYSIGQGINTALIFANTFLTTVNWKDLGKSFADAFNGLSDAVDWELLGTTVTNGLNAFVLTVLGFVRQLKWGEIGQNIGIALSAGIQNFKWSETGEAVGTCISGLFQLLNQFIQNTDWMSLGSGIIRAIGGFFATIDWGEISSTISSALIALYNIVIGLISETDWSGIPSYILTSIGEFLRGFDYAGLANSVGKLLGAKLKAAIQYYAGIWEILKSAWGSVSDYFSKYIEECGGSVIKGLFKGILAALASVGEWIVKNIFDPFIEGFKDAFGIHSPSTVMAEMGGYIIDGLKKGLTGIWDKVKSIITDFRAKIKAGFTGIKDDAILVFTAMKDKIQAVFGNMWAGIKDIVNTIIGGIESMVNKVISGLNSLIEALNKLQWDVPQWVPVIGGNKFGLNIQPINTVSIPQLANGGITTGSTLANIGEAGREAVLPLENNLSYLEPLADMIASKMEGVQTVKIVADESGLFKVVRESASDYYRRTGRPAFDF